MNNAGMKKFFYQASVFTGVCMIMMLQRAATKHILITDAAGKEIDRSFSEESFNLLISSEVSNGQSGKLTIPLPKSVSSDDIILEDRYIDHELLIYIDGREEGFYLDNAVLTDLDIIESAVCISENDSGSVCLDFKLDGLYANESSLTESSTIEVSFFKPYDKYDNIVVVDPVAPDTVLERDYADPLEKDIALDVALLLKGEAEKADNRSTKFYYTRLSSGEVSPERVRELIDETEADLVLRIGTESYENHQDGVRSYYNGEFFLRGFNNAEFAGLMAASCASKAGADVVGVYETNDDILSYSQVPSARVSVGSLGGTQDQERLSDKSYKHKLAEGLYQGIMQGIEEIK
nr:N-acetylmuramoyl-L-alanine amidase [uncultured Butyrivibrio sp.]